jgi:pimeloyl-ACP methyl ester carboxylesterase
VAIRFNGPHNEFGRMDFRSDLKRICCPVLILAGDRDPVMPISFSETIAECVPRHLVRFERFVGCGHGLHLEEPERTFNVLRWFITAEM